VRKAGAARQTRMAQPTYTNRLFCDCHHIDSYRSA
jgi:hypothetical protein